MICLLQPQRLGAEPGRSARRLQMAAG